MIFPDTFNVDKHVDAPGNIDTPDIFNDDVHVELFDNVAKPETFNMYLKMLMHYLN